MKIGWWERLVRRIMRMPIPDLTESFYKVQWTDETTDAVTMGIIFQKALDNQSTDG